MRLSCQLTVWFALIIDVDRLLHKTITGAIVKLMGDILVATSGYSYEDWRGILYPEELPKEEFLRYYALDRKSVV